MGLAETPFVSTKWMISFETGKPIKYILGKVSGNAVLKVRVEQLLLGYAQRKEEIDKKCSFSVALVLQTNVEILDFIRR